MIFCSKCISNFVNHHRFEKIKSHLDKLKKGLSEDHIDTIAIAIKVLQTFNVYSTNSYQSNHTIRIILFSNFMFHKFFVF